MLWAMKFLALIFTFLVTSPAFAAPCPSHGVTMVRTELLFGAGRVGNTQWRSFLAHDVTPRFPKGLTVLDGYGQWKMPDGAIGRERSRVLLIWHAAGNDADEKIDAIRDAYKTRFHQLSVMRVDSTNCVSF